MSAVIPSTEVTALNAHTYSYVLASPITPTDLVGKSTAKACHISSYKPAFFISFIYISSALRRISSFSSVISPGHRIANPGPGKGCLEMNDSGNPSSLPSNLTSSLNN